MVLLHSIPVAPESMCRLSVFESITGLLIEGPALPASSSLVTTHCA